MECGAWCPGWNTVSARKTLWATSNAAAGHMTVVCVLASPQGVAAFEAEGFDATVYTASIDTRLNDHAFIVPGLGDAGDRQFGLA